jgi:hypothetical protein
LYRFVPLSYTINSLWEQLWIAVLAYLTKLQKKSNNMILPEDVTSALQQWTAA